MVNQRNSVIEIVRVREIVLVSNIRSIFVINHSLLPDQHAIKNTIVIREWEFCKCIIFIIQHLLYMEIVTFSSRLTLQAYTTAMLSDSENSANIP